MNSQSHLVEKYLVTTKNQDSAAQKKMHPAVIVPEKIELKLQKPTIKLLEIPDNSSFQQRQQIHFERKANEQKLSLASTVNSGDLPYSNIEGPDTLDAVLIHNWISSGFRQTLWASASNDSVCFIPYNYSSRTNTTLKDSVKHSNKPYNKLNLTDSTSFLQRTEHGTTQSSLSKQKEPITHPSHHNLVTEPWFISALILFVAITGFIRLKWQAYLTKIFQAVTFSTIATKLQTSASSKEKVASFFLNILFYGNFSLFLYEYMVFKNHSYFHWTGWNLWLLIAAFLMAISFSKTIVYKFIGWVFRIEKQTTNYLFQSSVMNKAYGVILMPLVVLFPFLNPEASPIVLKIGLAAFVLMYFIQIVRGIGANLRDALSVYYIILYLCALEILPLSILYKVLIH